MPASAIRRSSGPTYNYVGTDETESRRFDINYTWGNHGFRAGYDYFEAVSHRGDNVVGPNQYYWSHGLGQQSERRAGRQPLCQVAGFPVAALVRWATT